MAVTTLPGGAQDGPGLESLALQAPKAAKTDARSGVPSDPDDPQPPRFVATCASEMTRLVVRALKAHAGAVSPLWHNIEAAQAQITEVDELIQQLKSLLSGLAVPGESSSPREQLRYRLQLTQHNRKLDTQLANRRGLRGEIARAHGDDTRLYTSYRARRAEIGAQARRVAAEYCAVLVRKHPATEALESSLPPAVEALFQQVEHKLDEAEHAVRQARPLVGY